MSTPDLALAYLLLEWAIRIVMILIVPLRRPPEAARSWLLLLFFLPVPGLLLYRFIGRASFPGWRRDRFRRTESERTRAAKVIGALGGHEPPLARLATTLGGLPASSGNNIALLSDYNGSIAAMTDAIDHSEIRVHLLTYIFADDRTGMLIADALARARARGVETRVLIDALGSRRWAKRSMAMLTERGVEAHLVLPVRFPALRRTRGDLRNHRKLCLIDGKLGFVGSQNIVDRDFKPGIVNDELVACVEGPVVAALDAVFASDWFMETEAVLPHLPLHDSAGNTLLQAMPSGPDFGVPGFERLLVELMHRAEREAVIVSPYLIPDEALLTAIKNAAARGVTVDLIVSQVVDQRLVSLAQRSYYQEMLEAGVHVHGYRDRLLHAKNASIDGSIGIVGSGNADVRSFMLNAEISLILHDREASAYLATIQRGYIARSDRLTLHTWAGRSKMARLLENLARMVSPLL